MSRSIPFREFFDAEKPEVRAEAEREYLRLLQQVEDLRAIREIIGVSQSELAARMSTPQGDVSKLERKTDIALRTLRKFVDGCGGELDIVVRLPGHPPMRLEKLSDAPNGRDVGPIQAEG